MDVKVDQLRIVNYPDPVLRQTAAPIESVDDTVRDIAARMIDLMHTAQGVGLAAPQVGLPLRMFVVNDPDRPDEPERVFINPVLSDPDSENQTRQEGCLSLPGIQVDVKRPIGITIEATDLDGQRFTMTSREIAARIWQHEYDHLDGVLILDKMSALDKLANRRAIKDLEAR